MEEIGLRKFLLILSLLSILFLSVAAVAGTNFLSFLGFTLGDSVKTCTANIQQLQNNDQLTNCRVINRNQVAANLEIGGAPATLILTFKNGFLSSVMIASYTSPNLKNVAQHILDELQGLVKKFGKPTSINRDIDNDMINSQKFTDVATWTYDDGEEMLVGIYNNGQTFSMYMIMYVTDADGPDV
jgi:hypothetical protein